MNQTMHTLYLRHGAAFDLANQARAMSTPERGVSEFAAFCELWPKVCALLDAPAQVELCVRGKWKLLNTWALGPDHSAINPTTAEQCIYACIEDFVIAVEARRVVLADGTVIREWPAVS